MAALLLTFLLQAFLLQVGTISGTLRTAAGTPATEVRVAAVDPEDGSLIGFAQTDSTGRYRIEEIPPGSYYIVAGRVDGPTYYPGTLTMEDGLKVSMTAGADIDGVNFVMQEASRRPPVYAAPGRLAVAREWTVPLQVRVEDGSPMPIFTPAGQPIVRLAPTGDASRGRATPLNDVGITVPASMEEYRVSVENLPEGYRVKSMVFGTTDLQTDTLKPVPTGATIQAQGVGRGSLTTAIVAVKTSPLIITLERFAAATLASAQGVTVRGTLAWKPVGTGRLPPRGPESIYLSGVPGVLYPDWTFEFRGVTPGRYFVVSPEGGGSDFTPFAASIVVGDADVQDFVVTETPVLPINIDWRGEMLSINSGLRDAVTPLASFNGRILASNSQEFPGGAVKLMGYKGPIYQRREVAYPLRSTGEFEFRGLLPGEYDLAIQVFGYPSTTQRIVIGEEDVNLEFTVTR